MLLQLILLSSVASLEIDSLIQLAPVRPQLSEGHERKQVQYENVTKNLMMAQQFISVAQKVDMGAGMNAEIGPVAVAVGTGMAANIIGGGVKSTMDAVGDGLRGSVFEPIPVITCFFGMGGCPKPDPPPATNEDVMKKVSAEAEKTRKEIQALAGTVNGIDGKVDTLVTGLSEMDTYLRGQMKEFAESFDGLKDGQGQILAGQATLGEALQDGNRALTTLMKEQYQALDNKITFVLSTLNEISDDLQEQLGIIGHDGFVQFCDTNALAISSLYHDNYLKDAEKMEAKGSSNIEDYANEAAKQTEEWAAREDDIKNYMNNLWLCLAPLSVSGGRGFFDSYVQKMRTTSPKISASDQLKALSNSFMHYMDVFGLGDVIYYHSVYANNHHERWPINRHEEALVSVVTHQVKRFYVVQNFWNAAETIAENSNFNCRSSYRYSRADVHICNRRSGGCNDLDNFVATWKQLKAQWDSEWTFAAKSLDYGAVANIRKYTKCRVGTGCYSRMSYSYTKYYDAKSNYGFCGGM